MSRRQRRTTAAVRNAPPAGLPPERLRALQRLAESLIDLDEDERRQAMARLLGFGLPQTLHVLAGCLLEIARRQRGVRREKALASVRGIGAAGVQPLKLVVLHYRGDALRVRLVGLLADLGRALEPHRRLDILLHLLIVKGAARSRRVRAAIDEAVARMQMEDERKEDRHQRPTGKR